MTLSGLALAGANQGLKGELGPDKEDGILWALEAMTLNLSGTELIALSACETGEGVVDYSDGVYGLVRAFAVAGARTVLMTLWPVGDEQAKDFMARFYHNWFSQKESDPALALHKTRLYYINHPEPSIRRNPRRWWAPFVLVETAN